MMDIKCCIFVVLICKSLMTSNIENRSLVSINMPLINCSSLSYSLIFHLGFTSFSDFCSYSFITIISGIFQKLHFQLVITTAKWSYYCLSQVVLRNLCKPPRVRSLMHIWPSPSFLCLHRNVETM